MINSHQDVAGGGIKAGGGMIVADALDGLADDGLMIDSRFGSDLPEDHNHARLDASLAGHFRIGVHLK